MTIWKALKYLIYICATVSGGLIVWILKEVLGKGPVSPAVQGLSSFVQANWIATIVFALSWLLLCASVWLLADIRERLDALSKNALLFISSKRLQPHHFDLDKYNAYYLQTPEYKVAKLKLQTDGSVLILGRSAGGKTRMAFQLAKASKGYWVLKLEPNFDWRTLEFPYFPLLFKLYILWFVDDLDKHLGRLDISRGERILGEHCTLRFIATCRSGGELEQVKSDYGMRSFVDSLGSPVVCPDLSDEQIVELARQASRPADVSLYDGTPGSVTLGLDGMRKRLHLAKPEATEILRDMSLLRKVLIFDPEDLLVKAVVQQIRGRLITHGDFRGTIDWLSENGFLKKMSQKLLPAHDVYLTERFLAYYVGDDPALESHLTEVGDIVGELGRGEDIHSIGIYWGMRGDHSRALHYLKLAVKKITTRPIIYYNLGVALGEKGLHDEAIAAFRRAIELKPDYAEAHHNLGVTLGEKGLHDEAIEAYHRAIELKPDFVEAHYNLGFALERKGLHDEAVEAYHRAIELKPDFVEAHVNLGFALERKGLHDEAIEAYHRAIELKPDDAVAHFNLGFALERKGLHDEAVEAYRRAIELKPDFVEAHYNLGFALERKGLHDEAVEAYRRAIELKPDYAEAHVNLGVALGRKGLHDEAIEAYHRAIELKPDDAEARFALGVLYLLFKRDRELATRQLEEAFKLKPELTETLKHILESVTGTEPKEP